jgi:hypothetical protein
MSVITYQNSEDYWLAPFQSDREAFAKQMFDQGKTASNPNWVELADQPTVGYRLWVDHAAAQEFLDYAIATAPTYNMTFVSTAIEDLPPA